MECWVSVSLHVSQLIPVFLWMEAEILKRLCCVREIIVKYYFAEWSVFYTSKFRSRVRRTRSIPGVFQITAIVTFTAT